MYDFRNILTQEPVAIAGALKSVIWVLVLIGLLQDPPFSAAVLAGIGLVSEVVLNLFVRRAVTPVAQPVLPTGTQVNQGTAEPTTIK